jgi:hypothetical protein
VVDVSPSWDHFSCLGFAFSDKLGDVTAVSMEQDAQVGAGQHSALGIGVVGRAHQGALQQLAALDVVAQVGDVILIGYW